MTFSAIGFLLVSCGQVDRMEALGFLKWVGKGVGKGVMISTILSHVRRIPEMRVYNVYHKAM
jgi:hypothetical protein